MDGFRVSGVRTASKRELRAREAIRDPAMPTCIVRNSDGAWRNVDELDEHAGVGGEAMRGIMCLRAMVGLVRCALPRHQRPGERIMTDGCADGMAPYVPRMSNGSVMVNREAKLVIGIQGSRVVEVGNVVALMSHFELSKLDYVGVCEGRECESNSRGWKLG